MEKLTAKLPKYFYIPSIQAFISLRKYLNIYQYCKDNPGVEVKQTISKWWGGTTDDILKEIQIGIHERIYLRKFLK